nr:hypothetical protein [Tanacetum cinerariifolium]
TDIAERQLVILGNQTGQRATDRVTARAAQACRQRQKVRRLRTNALHRLNAQLAKSQGAGLVDNQRGQVGQLFQKGRAANQNPV